MIKKVFLLTLVALGWTSSGRAQETEEVFMPRGELYFYWGYNRSWYTKSDIHFSSSEAVFTLYDVAAKDRQSPISFFDYVLNPTIPQFNVRFGYAIRNNLNISFGYDHMKYVMVQDQTVKISGSIAYKPETAGYGGCYDQADIVLSPKFLRYEHTNGLNYFSFDMEYFYRLIQSKNKWFDLAAYGGASVAVMYPRSDIDVFDVEGVNVFHVAGWGTSLSAGLRLKIGRHGFIQWGNRGGFVALPSVLCRLNDFDASQHFFFIQTAGMLGANFNLSKKKK